MKVILNTDVDKLGRRGDVVEVAAGYGRNFLLPHKLAITATKGALKQAESMQRARTEIDRQQRQAAEALAARVAAAPLRIAAKAGEEGQLFGSVTTAGIADELSKVLGEEVDRRKVEVTSPIRTLGTHSFSVVLHHEVAATGTVEVVAES
jgi:large subunit ribosomal protein L9